MSSLASRIRSLTQRSVAPAYVLLAIGLAATATMSYYAFTNAHHEEAMRFDAAVRQVTGDIDRRMERYENALIQTRAFFMSSPDAVSRKQFKNYVDNLLLLDRYPGIQGLGYSVRLDSEDVGKLEKTVREQGFPEFRVWPEMADSQRKERHSILYLEPFDWRNQRAFGFDMSSEPTRRAAMAVARDTGKTITSGKVKLVQETHQEPQPGFNIYTPVYQGTEIPETVEERREKLTGFVYSPFRADNLFEAIFKADSRSSPPIDFEIFDGKELSSKSLLYDFDEVTRFGSKNFQPAFETVSQIDAGGRIWSIYFATLPGFKLKSMQYIPWIVLIGGLLLSFLIFRVTRSTQKHYEEASESRKILETINTIGRQISGELELEKLLQQVTDAATRLARAEFGAFFYNAVDEEGRPSSVYTFSRISRTRFDELPIPKGTEVFNQSSRGEAIRNPDVLRGSGYGSYMAVPVISRSKEVIGGLFFGHRKEGRFGAKEEQLVLGLAAQAAVAIDNARLFERQQQALKSRDEFLSICSHELKTPLTTLKLQAQLQSRRLSASIRNQKPETVPEILKESIDRWERQVDRLTRLVDDMLDISRINTGRMVLNPQETDLSGIIREVAERLATSGQEKKLDLELDLPPEPVIGFWDAFRIEQVVMNLVTNAIKYGEEGKVRISLRQAVPSVHLSVSDQGMGIAPENHERIFQRFERAVSASSISGLGLGLYIVKQILDAHDAKIHVESTPGQGATFHVELPLRPPSFAVIDRPSDQAALG